MERRDVLLSSGVVVSSVFAGCLGSDDGPPEDPDERIAYYTREGADEDGARVEEIQTVAVGDSEVGDGYDLVFEYELDYASSDSSPSTIEENANWTAYHVFKSVFENDLDVERALIRASVPTVDQQGSESEAEISEVIMTAETASEITWGNIGADQVPTNADNYSFDPV